MDRQFTQGVKIAKKYWKKMFCLIVMEIQIKINKKHFLDLTDWRKIFKSNITRWQGWEKGHSFLFFYLSSFHLEQYLLCNICKKPCFKLLFMFPLRWYIDSLPCPPAPDCNMLRKVWIEISARLKKLPL